MQKQATQSRDSRKIRDRIQIIVDKRRNEKIILESRHFSFYMKNNISFLRPLEKYFCMSFILQKNVALKFFIIISDILNFSFRTAAKLVEYIFTITLMTA